jgi:cellulose synthase/poly-beta-1,6-N-acetylglucosamine synthase-like glycosyltransferase
MSGRLQPTDDMRESKKSPLRVQEMVPKISIFIPVYRESELLEPLLVDLLIDPYESKEIFLVVDEPTPKSLKLVDKFSDRVHFTLNGERKGKVNVLNDVVVKSSGKILLFLDSDVQIDCNSGAFLRRISEEMREAQIIEVKKSVIRDSLLARISSYDYLAFNFANWLFSRTLRKCLGFNGAAFAIGREAFMFLGGFRRVISEDLDMGIRSFKGGIRFKYLEDITVQTRAPSSWREWFKQRKRWAVGAALWLDENFKDLMRIVRKHPRVPLSLLLIFPSLPLLLIDLLIPDELPMKIIYISLLLLSTWTSLLLPPAAFTSTTMFLLKNLFLTVCNIGVYSSIFYVIARKLGYMFNPLEFVFFYLVYSPLWLLIMITSIARVFINPERINIDWKI